MEMRDFFFPNNVIVYSIIREINLGERQHLCPVMLPVWANNTHLLLFFYHCFLTIIVCQFDFE